MTTPTVEDCELIARTYAEIAAIEANELTSELYDAVQRHVDVVGMQRCVAALDLVAALVRGGLR